MPASSPADPRPITLLLGAVPWEVAPLEEALDGTETGTVAGVRYTRGELFGMPVVVSLTGVGKTNAGLVTGILYREFAPERVIFTGSGARVRPDIGPGHIIVAKDACFHDAGNLTEDGMRLLPVVGPGEGVMVEPFFRPDPGLLSVAMRVAADYEPSEPISVDGQTCPMAIRAGRIATGDLFGVSQWKLAEVRDELEADLLEMEGASIGQSCQTLGVPWLLIRAGADLLQAGDGTDEYLKYGPVGARQAALFTLAVIRELARSGSR